MKCHTICFYLPQYHPIKENDEWWGAGFTEWRNVISAMPRFKGHYQPHIPADLGFYDLRLEETRLKQAGLAKEYGIDGFCYYHYWFNGKMLLDRPFNDVLQSGKPTFPFCLCWANESWTRAWDGLDREILIKQEYNNEDSRRHIEWLVKAFKDNRYIKINGMPLFLIYRIDSIPNLNEMLSFWRKFACENGFKGLYICAIRTGFKTTPEDEIMKIGFDAIIRFQPNRHDFPAPRSPIAMLYSAAQKVLPNTLYQTLKLSAKANKIIDYERLVEKILGKLWPAEYRCFPCVFPSWDNTSRRKSATIIQNLNCLAYERWLRGSIKQVQCYPDQERIVFINAWNEWAEGCHLEPDLKNGHAFLSATRNAIVRFE
jgi:lipopolysaccharide biosynthesis protein